MFLFVCRIFYYELICFSPDSFYVSFKCPEFPRPFIISQLKYEDEEAKQDLLLFNYFNLVF